MAARSAIERLVEKVRTNPQTGCWEWQAHTRRGYGTFWFNGSSHFAHRVSWELLVGPIPDGLTIDHLCRNKRCVRPDHLEPVPAVVNTSRSWETRVRMQTCKRGHDMAPDIAGWVRPAGRAPFRYCRVCQLARLKRWRERNGPLLPPPAERTCCPSGHPYDEENTGRDAKGFRFCRQCRRDISRRYYEKKSAA